MAIEQVQPLSMLLTPDGDGNVVLTVGGEVDVLTADQLRAALNESLTLWEGQVVVDFAGVSFLDSQGIAALLRVHKDCGLDPGRLTIRSPQPQARKVFELTGLDTILRIEN
jgi:anti-sigma B factor antagonist